MKNNKYLLFFLLVITPGILKSQIIDNYGFKIAFTRSKMDIKEINEGTSRRSDINFALFFEKNVNKSISTVIQLEYARKGFVSEQMETNEGGEEIQVVRANTRLDYISLPVFMRIKYNKSTIKPFFQFGPRLDYMIGYRKGVYKFTKTNFIDKTAKYLAPFSLGGSLSLGCIVPLQSNKSIIIEARYNRDFLDLWSKAGQWFGKNVSYDCWVGISF